jgi:hypothetical protein
MIIKDPNYAHEYYGMSTDTKPLSVPNASLFYEIDTSDIYMFDEDGQQWFKQSGESGSSSGPSGGGSSSGILIVNGTVENVDGTNTFVLDKTWQEIHDADYAIVNYEASLDGNTVASSYIITSIMISNNGVYIVAILGVEPGSNQPSAMPLTANSSDGYPKFIISGGEPGQG